MICKEKRSIKKSFSTIFVWGSMFQSTIERNIKRVNGPQGGFMKGRRQSSLEPIFGTLTQFMGLGKVITLGLEQANKCMHLSAVAYNLKKYLKFVQKRTKSGAGCLTLLFSPKKPHRISVNYILKAPNIDHSIGWRKKRAAKSGLDGCGFSKINRLCNGYRCCALALYP